MLSHFSHIQLCSPMDHGPPGSSVHGILQARIQEWVAMPSSKGSSRPRDQTSISYLHWQVGSLPLAPPGKQVCSRKNSKTASEFLSQSPSSIREELCNSQQGNSSLEIQFSSLVKIPTSQVRGKDSMTLTNVDRVGCPKHLVKFGI